MQSLSEARLETGPFYSKVRTISRITNDPQKVRRRFHRFAQFSELHQAQEQCYRARRITEPSGAAAEVTEAIEKAGGCVVGSYKDPLGGHPVFISILPIEAVEPTPFQRDLSDAHHKRLADVITAFCWPKTLGTGLGFARPLSGWCAFHHSRHSILVPMVRSQSPTTVTTTVR